MKINEHDTITMQEIQSILGEKDLAIFLLKKKIASLTQELEIIRRQSQPQDLPENQE